MKASVIVSNYDPKGQLLESVENALGQTLSDSFDVILPLHGLITREERSSLSEIAATDSRLKLVEPSNQNRATALNEAVAASHAEHILFIESHCHAPPDLLHRHLSLLETADAVQGAFRSRQVDNWVSRSEDHVRAWGDQRRQGRGLRADEFNVHNASFRRSIVQRHGGFDDRVPNIAEVPLLHRILDGGADVRFSPELSIEHVNHQVLGDFVGAITRRGQDVGRLWRFEPSLAAGVYPIPALERHPDAIRTMRPVLRMGAETARGLAYAALGAARLLPSKAVHNAATRRLVSASVRAGVLRGYS